MRVSRSALLGAVVLAVVGVGMAVVSQVGLDPVSASSVSAGLPQEKAGADVALKALLTAQAADWNRGDIDGFMRGYWKSAKTTFAGASGISRGWQTVLEHYHKNYPNRATMGHLDFSEIEITPLGNDAALILGRWHLNRDAGAVGGIFTLVARKFPEGWRIIHDHTSTDAAK
jgi:beta-aspartyl-peptidase (threonine type)